MKLHRVVCEWAGTAVTGRAVTVLHYTGSEQEAPPVAALKSAFASNATLFPAGTTITIPNSGDSIEDTTGELVSVWTGTGGGTVTGTAAGATVLGVGACIGWRTGGILNGRRLRGRTFLVPLGAFVWEPNGTFSTSAMTQLQATADAIMATGGLAVWHRPSTSSASDGNSYGVTSNTVRDKPAILTSRRD